MAQFSGTPIERDADPSKYHPRCGEEHSRKPAKALIGVGLLIVLSFLLHEINGKRSILHLGMAQPGISADNQ